ncbi:MAG: acetylxylan esterase [Planctomycetota bacterium]|nr:acetylxylan esterase [Planctomycetota bacterium]
MNIRAYLCQEAARRTEESLASIRSLEDWDRERPARRAVFLDRLGLAAHLEAPRTPLNATIAGELRRDGYRVEQLHFESLPGLYVTANLYVPEPLAAPAPAVAYFCGHAQRQKFHYQAHPRQWCRLGFVALVVDTVQFGEVRGEHWGAYGGRRFDWISRGYTPAGVECWNGIRALDLLCGRPEVDAARIGITGTSGGGGMSWWLGAADGRAAVVAPSCGTGTLRSHLRERTLDGHCDCMVPLSIDGWDLADVGALIAPRPLLIASSDGDHLFSAASIRETAGKLERLYGLLGARERFRLFSYPGPHGYSPASRKTIFAWFLKHLAGRAVEPGALEDIDPSRDEPDEALRVFSGPRPHGERVADADDWFVPRARAEAPAGAEALQTRREEVARRLRALSFARFPAEAPPPEVELRQRIDSSTAAGLRWSFASEPGWRLDARMAWGLDLAAPRGVILALPGPGDELPGEDQWKTHDLLRGAWARWATCIVETRGVGMWGWPADLHGHVRRGLAVLGHTVASLRVYDTLRALAALRTLEGVHPERIALAASGEMVPVALCAALLDGRVCAAILAEPPPTLDTAAWPGGNAQALELLHALRITDLPELAALLWPCELVFAGARPAAYEWTEEAYRRLGPPGIIRRVTTLDDWRTAPDDLPRARS